MIPDKVDNESCDCNIRVKHIKTFRSPRGKNSIYCPQYSKKHYFYRDKFIQKFVHLNHLEDAQNEE